MQDLERRLRGRRSDDDQAIRKRLETAKREIQEAEHYQFAIVNDDLERAVADLEHVVQASRVSRAASSCRLGWPA